jgi:hypothetical protein
VLKQCDMKMLFGHFNAEVGREDIFNPAVGNKDSQEISNDSGFRVFKLCHV